MAFNNQAVNRWRAAAVARGRARGAALALIIGLLFSAAGCGDAGPSGRGPAAAGKPLVVASIHPLADLTQRLLGDAVVMQTLLPPGVSPHGVDITPAKLKALHDADLLVAVGLNLDPWAMRAAERSGNAAIQVVRFADLVGVKGPSAGGHEHEHAHAAEAVGAPGHDHSAPGGCPVCSAPGMPNAHLWLDPVLTKRFVEALAGELAKRYPQWSERVEVNKSQVLAELDALDAEHRDALGMLANKNLITFHNAFDPLADRYGLKVVAHLTEVELTPGGEVTPSRMAEAIDAVKKHGLTTLYAEPQYPESAVRAIARQTGARVLKLDPEGNPNVQGYRTYFEMMRSNLQTIVQGQTAAE